MRFLLGIVLAGALSAQPPILYSRGAVNAASLAPPGLPNGAIATGSIFSIFGENLGPAAGQSAATFPLGATLLGVSIAVTQGNVTTPAYPIFVSSSQVNAVMPSTMSPGMASMRLTYQARQSNAIAIRIATASPGIFAVSSGGFGPGIFQNYSAAGVPTVNSLSNPAAPGQTVVIWATGLGPVTYPDNQPAAAGDLPTPVAITVGGQVAQNLYSGRAPGYSGVDQINVTIPANAPLGCWVPVTVNAGGVVSNTATIAIAAPGAAACSDPANPLSSMVRTAGSQAVVMLAQISHIDNLNAATAITGTFQQLYSRFATRPASPYNFDPYLSYPPAGTCTVHQTSGDASVALTLRGALPAGASLNPQPAQIYNNGTQSFTLPASGDFYAGVVGAGVAATQAGLGPPASGATFTIDPGGANARTLAVAGEPAPAWTRPSGLLSVSRTIPLNLAFTPADVSAPGSILLYAYSAPVDATVEVQCLTAPGATSFTIPADTLANLPATYQLIDGSYASLMIGNLGWENALVFSNGLASNGILFAASWLSQSVVLQ